MTSPETPSLGARLGWKVVGSVAALVAVVSLAVGFANLASQSTRVERRQVELGSVRVVELRSEYGDIDVAGRASASSGGGPDEIVDLTAHLVDGLLDSSMRTRFSGNRLIVELSCATVPVGLDSCDLRLEAVVPADVAVVVVVDSGDVVATNLDGPVSVQSDNGDIEAVGLGGRLDLTTDNGDIDGVGLSSDRVAVESANGDISVAFRSSPLSVEGTADNGNVEIVVPDDGEAYAVDARSDNGTVATPIATDPASDRVIDVTSDNGDVRVRY